MKKIFNNLLLLLAIILFSKCNYPFSDDYFNKIIVSEPVVSLSLTNFKENDTLIKPKEIKYIYNASDKNLLYQINFYVDNQIIYQDSKKEESFLLEIKNLSSGKHNLKIEYIFRLGSESLLDLTGSELVKKEENISFEVNNNVPIEIKEVKIVDGVIRIYFKPYKLIDEISSSTEILLFSESEYGSYVFNINEYHLNNNFYDYRNFGSNISYHTKVKNSYSETTSEKKSLKVDDSFTVNVEIKNADETIIKWTKHPVYDTFSPHVNIENTELRFDPSILLDTQTAGEKTITLGQFGKTYNYKVQHKISNYRYSPAIFEGSFYLGEKFVTPENDFIKIIYNSNKNSFYGLSIASENQNVNNVYIYELDADNLQVIKKTKIATTIGSIGDIFLDNINGYLIVDLNSKSLVLNSNSLSKLSEYLISDYANYNYNSNKITRYRGNNIVMEGINNNSLGIEIFDIKTKNKIYSKSSSASFKITDGGNYFWHYSTIYKIENSKVSPIYAEQRHYLQINGLVSKPLENKLYFLNAGLKTIDLNSNKVSTLSRKISEVNNLYYSKEDQKIIGKKHENGISTLYTIDINSDDLKTIKVKGNANYILTNNKLISTNGFFLNNFF